MIKENNIYALNSNEVILQTFEKDNEDTLINPTIREEQNQDNTLTFQVNAKSKKWNNVYNPENLYLVNGKVFSANFDSSIDRTREEDDEDLITVTAYERQKLLSRKYVRAWNSETGFEAIDDFMVVILSSGDKPLLNNGEPVNPKYPIGSSGYALEALLYGTGWTVGECDIYEYENGEIVRDTSGNPIYLKFDLETDQMSIYDNILQIQELWGGILVFDSLNKIVHHRDETLYLPYTGYEVKYQKNIISSNYIGNNKIITKLAPLGEGGLNIKLVNNDSLWLTNFSYTNNELEEIINNPEIYEPKQLKLWGERKLKELCKPRYEFTCSISELKTTEGLAVEKINLNDIVDVIDFEFIQEKTKQLRVVMYERNIWDYSNSTITISDITLETTDIFKKNVGATNKINNGTLDTSRVVDYYKNGQSLKETLMQVDETIVTNYSNLIKEDNEIRAEIGEISEGVDNLNNEVVVHEERISSLELDIEGIELEVSRVADITAEKESQGLLEIADALEGELLAFSIRGDNNVFSGPLLGDDTILSDDTILLGDSHVVINSKEYMDEPEVEILTGALVKTETEPVNFYFDTSKTNCRCALVPIVSEKTYTVNKLGGKVFAIGSYYQVPTNMALPNRYIEAIEQNETQLKLTTGKNDNYLLIFYYNGDLDTETETNLYNSLTVKSNYYFIDLGIDDVLRSIDEGENRVYDEVRYVDKKMYLIRRIGVADDGSFYALTDIQAEEIGEYELELSRGYNTIEVLYYDNVDMYAKYVKLNEFTEQFATTYQVEASIKILSNSINMMVKEMVGKSEIIAALNLAVENGQGIVELIGNTVKITSDKFKLTAEGAIDSTSGKIAGWNITSNSIYKGLSGLTGADSTTLNTKVFYAGRGYGKISDSEGNKDKFYITNNGDIYGHSFYIYDDYNGDPGFIKFYNPSNQVTSYMTFEEVSTYRVIAGDGQRKGTCMHGRNRDGEDRDPHIYTCYWNGSNLEFWVDTANIGSLSDERLKEDIEPLSETLLKAIEEIELKQFKLEQRNGKISAGIISQELLAICEKYEFNLWDYEVIYKSHYKTGDDTLYYMINYEQLLLLKTKCLENRILKLEEKVNKILSKEE